VTNRRDAWTTLAILTVINLLNYIDRFVAIAALEPIKREFGFSDAEVAIVTTAAFMISYSAASPLFGRLGDLFTRKYLISTGVAVWSIATAGAGLARNFWQLFLPRSLVGIGEASYATTAPGIITDLYETAHRGRALAVFYAAIPIGSALGYVLGGAISQSHGWRTAFLLVGLPGILFALLALVIREPKRGATEAEAAAPAPSLRASYLMLWHNRTYVLVSLGFIAYTFALGGLAAWFPSLLQRYNGWSVAGSNQVLGIITVAAGFLGTFVGGFLGDYFLRLTKNSYLWISGLGMICGAPIAVLALASRTSEVYLPAIFAAEFFLFLNTGPLNTILLNCVPAQIRSTAMAVNIFLIHALGDVISPPIIGALSDRFGLFHATLIAPVMMVLSGLILLQTIRYNRRGSGSSLRPQAE